MSQSKKFWAELHCHSEFSRDCSVTLVQIIEQCRQRNLSVIALTDHNEIAGAVQLQKMAPDWLTVIVGEEIATTEGDLIGLYLKEKIEPRQSIADTLVEIKRQGGLALLPHPLDRIRQEAVGLTVATKIAQQIDAIEIFNGRCLWPADNRRAAALADQEGLVGFVGSDAHVLGEYGRSVVGFAERPASPTSFMDQLRSATLTKKWAGPIVHGRTFLVKRKKRR